ncbi:hypothetical protein [uncultured Tolumonas sp.]|uniref:hypothetical protein n=1 Tax=uncultured Tolumonas sp. TaxID=263765 RepID=UPI00292DD12F|nr:hypothetical protein [uncultured Tolumonas sp.]
MDTSFVGKFAHSATTLLLNKCCAVLVFLLVLTLAGCAHRGSDWTQVKGHGPLIAPNQFAPLYRHCAANRARDSDCQWAFADSQDNKIQLSDLTAQLDDTLLHTKEAQTWPLNNNGQHKFPYHFTILSLSPTIVVGYPIPPSAADHCSSVGSSCNYLHSERFAGRYEIATQFAYSTDLVWFSPEHGARLFKVPPHANTVFFAIAGHSAQLKRKGNGWLFTRRD